MEAGKCQQDNLYLCYTASFIASTVSIISSKSIPLALYIARSTSAAVKDKFGYLDAGLPDVYGYMYMSRACYSLNAAGAFSESYTNGSSAPSSISSAGDAQIYFYASSYNSIYGSSDTVQPPAIKVRVKTRYI